MRLHELTARSKLDITPGETSVAMLDYIPTYEDDSPYQEFIRLLQSRGFEPFEPGAFGVAFAHPGLPYVIKVFSTEKDKGYLAFLRFCLDHRGNPHLPVFRGKFNKVEADDNDVLYWCRIERLDPLMDEAQNRLRPIVGLAKNGSSVEQIKAAHDDPDDLVNWGFTDTFLATIVELAAQAKAHGFYFDCHGNNVMERSDLTLVVIDPWDSYG